MLDLIEKIRKYIEGEKIQWRGHILSRMIQRRIKISVVKQDIDLEVIPWRNNFTV